jgi:2-iminobutanoate/2-iminopropanoate deaminase
MKKAIETKKSPEVIGPYSQAIQVGDLVFCSGQIGKDPKTNAFVDGGIEAQTKQILTNLKAILNEAGTDLSNIVKPTVYLKNFNDFAKMNAVYASFFQKPYPARATVEVARLPQDALVEIECIAVAQSEEGCCGNCKCS